MLKSFRVQKEQYIPPHQLLHMNVPWMQQQESVYLFWYYNNYGILVLIDTFTLEQMRRTFITIIPEAVVIYWNPYMFYPLYYLQKLIK